jgi:pantoate--beta-alanine ligase
LVVLPTVREADGLALSSRNALLTPEARRQAVTISCALMAAQAAVKGGARDAEHLQAAIEAQIRTAPMAEIDYVAICNPDTLEPLTRIAQRAVALVAARFGSIRLIDNILVD